LLTTLDVSVRAQKIAYELGYLPLGLEAAGAYLSSGHPIHDHSGLPLTEPRDRLDHYIKRLKSNFSMVANYKPGGKFLYGEPLVNAWKMNLECIQSRNPTAIRLLSIFGMLDTDTIGLDVFEPMVDFDPSTHPTEQGKSETWLDSSFHSKANVSQGELMLRNITTTIMTKFESNTCMFFLDSSLPF
jgi:hypothetical protein